MRHLIHEMSYETPLRAGMFRYEREGRPTGAVEHWRLTAAQDGYRFLRVDLDARDAPSGHSFLYHLTLDPDGRPLQLKLRFWSAAWNAAGTLLWDDTGWTGGRTVNNVRFEDQADGPRTFWFPATTGLALLATGAPPAGSLPAVTLASDSLLNPHANARDVLALQQVDVELRWLAEETVSVSGRELAARILTVAWNDQKRTLWLDNTHWPVKMARQDGLVAVEKQNIQWVVDSVQ